MPTDDLVTLAQSGDVAAREELVVRFYGLVYSTCRKRGVHPDDAYDRVQEVFLAVFQSLSQFEPGRPGGFAAWLLGVVRFKVADYYRQNGRQVRGAGGTTAAEQIHNVEQPDEPSSAADEGEQFPRIGAAMEIVRREVELSTWSAFLKTTLENKRAAEVASELGISNNAVYVAKSRVLRRLREVTAALEAGDKE